jgi:hypothetical protein
LNAQPMILCVRSLISIASSGEKGIFDRTARIYMILF